MYEIVEDVLTKITTSTFHFDSELNEFVNYPQLRRLLLKDGYVIEDGKLVKTFENVIDFNKNETLAAKSPRLKALLA
jgi:hypothetical protein